MFLSLKVPMEIESKKQNSLELNNSELKKPSWFHIGV